MSSNIIELKKISKRYSDNSVLSNLDLNIPLNSVTSVIGPNGCGKTTLFKVILGITDHENGKINKVSNEDIGFMLDDCKYYDHLTLLQNLTAMSKLTKPRLTKKSLNDIISITFCDKIKSKPFKSLSSGQLKKALFALTLISDPNILILDEPLNSLDLKERIDMISTIRYLKEAKNKTILVSSHDLASLYELCDIFCFLKDGKIIHQTAKKEIDADKLSRLYLDIYK